MEVTLPLEKMTTAEKLRVMETLWADPTRPVTPIVSNRPPGMRMFCARDEGLRSGQENPLDWEAVKAQLRKLRP